MSLHPLLRAAAAGVLPGWSVAGEGRRAHMARVAELLERWGLALGLEDEERLRWKAAGLLHDALRDADPELLRAHLGPEHRDLPDPVLHGPAVANRLREEGVSDEPFLQAVAHHTVGHPQLDRLGRSLYAGDFLEAGREGGAGWRARLRDRMPHDEEAVLVEIAQRRIGHLVEAGLPLLPQTVGMWNAWVRKSHG